MNNVLKTSNIEFEQELSYCKVRIELGKEIGERVDGEVPVTEQEQEHLDQLEAMTRQTFDPETRTYDEQKRRVTDLPECSRVTLPRPLPARHEAFIEIRRDVHTRIFEDYKQEFCNKDGEQKTNLTPQESASLKKLQKRMKEEDLVIMKTDKSSKLSITNLEEYIRMGQEHTHKDIIIDRAEIMRIEAFLNGHCRAWGKIWQSGKNNGHTGRIMTSKTTRSNNVA